jgi:ABC-type multidrug transport system ATPase subunit
MQVQLDNLGKRYQRHWVFRSLSLSLAAGSSTAILGHNGSGKSTLLRILAGMQPPSEGSISWTADEGKRFEPQDVFAQVAFCAPGMDLPEELTLLELLDFHFSFKKPLPGLSVPSIIALMGLQAAARKPVADFSSGMKQRVKLAQAIFCNSSLLLLDEPCTNLDDAGVQQYLGWIARYAAARTVVVASNDEREYSFCGQRLRLEQP